MRSAARDGYPRSRHTIEVDQHGGCGGRKFSGNEALAAGDEAASSDVSKGASLRMKPAERLEGLHRAIASTASMMFCTC
jgi:hypothetical protein